MGTFFFFYLNGRQKKDKQNDERESGMTVTVKVPAPDHLQKCLFVGLFPGLSWQVFTAELPEAVSLSEKFREPTKQESNQPLLCVCVCVSHCRV